MDQNQALSLINIYQSKNIWDFVVEDISGFQDLIQYLSVLYYELESPLISDGEYDMLYKKLKEIETYYDISDKVSQYVGSAGKQSTFEKVAHSRPMISLDNTYNADDLRDFDDRVQKLSGVAESEYMLEFKFDGLGVELVYEAWKLIQAITRGNGIIGEDVTENVGQIKNIPKQIAFLERLEVRGEVVMPISSFEKINAEARETGEKVFSNPRNAASWSLRVLDIEITKKRDLKFFAYDISDFSGFERGKYKDMIHFLEQQNFEISSYFKKCSGIQDVIFEIEHFGAIKKQIDFEIDGLVLKYNDMSLWKKIGYTEHHPRYAIAYKFPAEIVTTELLSVEHSVGRTGTITPVANLEAVTIGGAIIRRSTLHNYEEVEKLGIKVGDRVFLKRAGEVIPKIISVAVAGNGESILPPEYCPSCGTKVVKDDDKVRTYCPNNSGCPAQIGEKFAFAVGKHGFDIDNFGEKQAELFVSLGWLKNLWDIFRLKNYREEILQLEGFQEKSVNKLLESIEEVRELDLVTFIKALWIPWVGKKTAKTLAKYFQSFANSPEIFFFERSQEELENLPDIGPEVARSVVLFFREQQAMIQDLLGEIEILFPTKLSQFSLEQGDETQTSKWQWKKICITGSFEGYSRDDLVKIIEDAGGECMSAVTAKTEYLLAGEKAGSKLSKAQELGVKVLSLDEFWNM